MNYHLFELGPIFWQVLISWKNKPHIIIHFNIIFKTFFYLLERRIVCIAYPNIAILLKNDPIPIFGSRDIDCDTNLQLLLDDIHPKIIIYVIEYVREAVVSWWHLTMEWTNLAIVFWWFLFIIIWSKNFIIFVVIWIGIVTWSFSRFSHSRSKSFKKLFW